MGVLACDRRGCENIMCDFYVPSVGYICCECKEEFVAQYNGAINIEDDLSLFVNTYKFDRPTDSKVIVEEFFKQHAR